MAITTLQVSVPEPCGEDWNRMAPRKQGRHCDVCSKTVHDLSEMNASQVAKFVLSNPGACIRANLLALQTALVFSLTGQNTTGTDSAVIPYSPPLISPVEVQGFMQGRRATYFPFHIVCTDSGSAPDSITIHLQCGSFSIQFNPDKYGNASVSLPDSVTSDSIYLTVSGNGFEHKTEIIRPLFFDAWNYVSPATYYLKAGKSDFLLKAEAQFYPVIVGGIPQINYQLFEKSYYFVNLVSSENTFPFANVLQPEDSVIGPEKPLPVINTATHPLPDATLSVYGITTAIILVSLILILVLRVFFS